MQRRDFIKLVGLVVAAPPLGWSPDASAPQRLRIYAEILPHEDGFGWIPCGARLPGGDLVWITDGSDLWQFVGFDLSGKKELDVPRKVLETYRPVIEFEATEDGYKFVKEAGGFWEEPAQAVWAWKTAHGLTETDRAVV